MRRRGVVPSPFRALAYHQAAHGNVSDSGSMIRSFNLETNPTRPLRPSPLTASAVPDFPLDVFDRIRSFPLFESAPEEFIKAVVSLLKPQIHSPQDQILKEGDDARAMFWLVRGVVAVTSRDCEAVYAELKAGSFFGEIGILMNIPRTATIIARTRCLLVVLKKEDLAALLPKFPAVEKELMDEAQERLAILNKKRFEAKRTHKRTPDHSPSRQIHDSNDGLDSAKVVIIGSNLSKKRKSPTPSEFDGNAASTALGSGHVSVRTTLRELPLFASLPADILHFLGLSAQPKVYAPFTDIVQKGTRGCDIYFIVRGEVEVIHDEEPQAERKQLHTSLVRPRLAAGQYFGEVTSLGLSQDRTATVRSITQVECLMIPSDTLEELWERCPPEIRQQVEQTARRRLKIGAEQDEPMLDSNSTGLLASNGARPSSDSSSTSGSSLVIDNVSSQSVGLANGSAQHLPLPPKTPIRQIMPTHAMLTPGSTTVTQESECMEPGDPDPFLSVDLENFQARRRSSLGLPTILAHAEATPPASPTGAAMPKTISLSPIYAFNPVPSPPDTIEMPAKRARTAGRTKNSVLPAGILAYVFQYFSIRDLLRLRGVCQDWKRVLTTSRELCRHVDLHLYNRFVTDAVVINVLAPFIGQRPVSIDISNCFHLTDEGFSALWRTCGRDVRRWKMRSVWDVGANQILEMAENAKSLEEIDWSNCRKVGDNLLARVVGWVVPDPPPTLPSAGKGLGSGRSVKRGSQQEIAAHQSSPLHKNQAQLLPPGTVIGCPKLRRLNLSYCKHITDRSMAHLALHANTRLEELSLTRCTSITDAGFQTWAPFCFSRLTRLQLADCTYLTDNSIVALVNAAKNLTHLDLSFCCALSDTATEVVALGLPRLVELRLAFCGSAVSEASMTGIALHLTDLEGLSVRGCVRVTGKAVDAVLDGCTRLRWLDVSQCRNLEPWLRAYNVARWGFDDRGPTSPYNRWPTSVMGLSLAAFGFGSAAHGASSSHIQGPAASAAGSGYGLSRGGAPGSGPMRNWPRRPPVRFIVEKGPVGLR